MRNLFKMREDYMKLYNAGPEKIPATLIEGLESYQWKLIGDDHPEVNEMELWQKVIDETKLDWHLAFFLSIL